MTKPKDTPGNVQLSAELGHLVGATGLLACVDDAYQERGDWAPLVQAFADAVQAAERERCELACLGLKNPPRDIRAPLTGIDVACDVANAMAEKCAAVIRGA